MTPLDLGSAIGAWAADELGRSSSRDDVAYMIACGIGTPAWGSPSVRIFVKRGDEHASDLIPWPPDEERTRRAVRRSLSEIGLLKPAPAGP